MRFAWPLTGRREEMQAITGAIADPNVAGMVICGATGVGKSRIAREAISVAASGGCEARWAFGTVAARQLPLSAFASWAGLDVADNLQLVRSVIDSLTSAPPDKPVVVGVDDAHLLDDLSTFVLHQIAQRRAAKMVLTIRSGDEITPATRELWNAGPFDRLDLQPLSFDETTSLLSATLGGTADPDAVRRLWQLTRGNPLYLRHIVEQEVTDGRLDQRRGYWRWTGEPSVPPGLAEMLESRIGALPARVGDVIDVLAVGEPIELESLSRITDPAAIEEADTRGLIALDDVRGRVEVRVAHPLYGEVRRKHTAITRLRRLRGLVSTELAGSESRDELRTVVRRASLSLDSDLVPNADLLIEAAKGAVWLADLALAERLANAASRAGGGAEADIVRAHALSLRSRGEDANDVLAGIDSPDGSADDRARVAFLQANNLLWQLGNPIGARDLMTALSRTTPPSARGCIDAFDAEYWAAMGNPGLALESAKGIDHVGLPAFASVVTNWALTIAHGDAGQTDAAVAAAEAGYAVAKRSFDAAHMRFVIADAHVGALLAAGHIEAAHHVSDALRDHAANLPGGAQLYSAAVGGRAALAMGRLDKASSLLNLVVGVLAASGETIGWTYRCQIPYTIALAIRGFVEEADDALAEFEANRHPSWRCVDYEAELARGWVCAAQGAVSEAIAAVRSAAETARASGQFAAEVRCLQTATQFGDGSCAERLRELEKIVEGPRAGLAAMFAEALRAGDGTELTAVSEGFEQIGDLVAAVDAAAHGALAYRRADRKGSAMVSSTRADELARRCGDARTPALRKASQRLPLSDRECEIVMLIGQGLSTRAIADRLMLSVRTVEGHVYRAMSKTGVGSRKELAALLPRQGFTPPHAAS